MLSRLAMGFYTPGEPKEDKARRKKALVLLSQLAQEMTLPSIERECDVIFGSLGDSILEKARQLGADLIIIHSRNPRAAGMLLGSTASAVVKYADTSVLVIRTPQP